MTKKRRMLFATMAIVVMLIGVMHSMDVFLNKQKQEEGEEGPKVYCRQEDSSDSEADNRPTYILSEWGGHEGMYIYHITPEERKILEKVVFAEAGTTESLEGQTAVAAEILNRVYDDSTRFPKTIEEVVYQEGQYYDGVPYWTDEDGVYREVTDDDVTEEVKVAVDYALQGADPTKKALGRGALFHHTVDDTVRDNQVKIGNLCFSAYWDGYGSN